MNVPALPVPVVEEKNMGLGGPLIGGEYESG